jgi:hypothetical protein
MIADLSIVVVYWAIAAMLAGETVRILIGE